MNNTPSSQKPPIKMTRLPSRISGHLLREGIQKIARGAQTDPNRSYVSKGALGILKKSGLSLGLSRGSKHSVSRQKFLQMARELEKAGVIKHRQGFAEDVFNEKAEQAAWEIFREKNIKKAIKKIAVQERKDVDVTERDKEELTEELVTAQKVEKKLLKKERLKRAEEDIVQKRLSKISGKVPGHFSSGRAVSFRPGRRQQGKELRQTERAEILERLYGSNIQPQSGNNKGNWSVNKTAGAAQKFNQNRNKTMGGNWRKKA